MKPRYPQYMHLNGTQLDSAMTKLYETTSQDVVRKILNTVREDKALLRLEKRSAKAVANTHSAQWRQIMEPLRAELQRVHGCLKYRASPERDIAFDAYQTVLLTLRDRLQAMAKPLSGEPQTPASLAKAKKTPNEGTHWVDWVPAKVRERVETLFHDIPYRKQARVFVPFRSVVTTAQHNRLAAVMRKSIMSKREALLAVSLIRKDDETEAKIAELDAALAALNRLPDDSPLPRDWRKLGFAMAITKADGCQE